ncbi:hypothetical protein BSKO_11415 [Bryopsis sp. KO-2023]|nr:hypothetical protein BSKO_11415 [Bryopsis sp. KO-2023]
MRQGQIQRSGAPSVSLAKATPRSLRWRCLHDRVGFIRPLRAATDSGTWGEGSKPDSRQNPESLLGLQKVIQDAVFNNEPPQGDWEEIEGCWVLRPSSGNPPEAVVHFLGGAFIGAAPQLAYRGFLEALADREILVVATPFNTTFDHLRTADEAQFKFDSAIRALGPYAEGTPVYGVGHSLGSLIHLLISSRYAIQRAGNILLSFNNKPATEVVPFLAQVTPSISILAPIMSQLSTSPFRPTAEMLQEALKGMSPSVVRQVAPILEQFAPIYMDVSQGRQEFTPSPEDTRERIRSYYGVPRNLLMKFTDDTLDESDGLASMLQVSGIASILDMTVRTLPGDHMRPMQKNLVDLPPEFNQAANQAFTRGGEFFSRLSDMANEAGQSNPSDQLRRVSEGVSGMASLFKDDKDETKSKTTILADEIAVWMGVGGVVAKGPRVLQAGDVRDSTNPS